MKDTHDTPVMFRMFKGEVLAIFPLEPGTNNPSDCLSYAHIGQHGACDPLGCIRSSRPAKRHEYLPLYRELKSVGYRLKVIHRTPTNAYRTRCELLARH